MDKQQTASHILFSARVCVCLTSMASKPQYSRASCSRGTSACSKRVVPHVFKMKRLLETNMLLSLREERTHKERRF